MTQGFTRMVVGALLLAGGLPALAQSKMVTLAEVAQGEAGASIWVSGTVASRQQAALSAEVSGRVEWIAEFGSRVFLPSDLVVDVRLEDGTRELLYFDTNYNATFALMHEDYLDDAIALDMGVPQIRLYVLLPLDLAVSKIARFADNDKEDIAELVRLGLTTANEIEQRATQAMAGYVGGLPMLRLNLRDAVALARQAEAERGAGGNSRA